MPTPQKSTYQVARRSRWATVWRWLIRDPWRKGIALVLAIGCWWVLNLSLHRPGSQQWEKIDNVPVSLEPDDDLFASQYDISMQSLNPREVALLVAVDAWGIDQLTAKNFRIHINPQNLHFTNDGLRTQPLEATYTLRSTDLVEKPDGVTLRGFAPSVVSFHWDRKIAKQVPVQLNLVNQLPDTLACHAQPAPPLHVIGPAYLVNQISVIETEPILLNQQSPGTVTLESVQLQLPSQFATLELERRHIPVNLEITDLQQSKTRFVKDIRLNYLSNPDSALVLQNAAQLPRKVSIYVSGPAGLLKELKADRLMAICDLTPFSMPGPQDVTVQVMNLPPEVTVTRMTPPGPVRVVLAAPSAL